MLPIVEVFIGLVLVFTLVSLLASVINEWISGVLNTRGRLFWRAIGQMLGKDLSEKVEHHHLLQSLRSNSWFTKKISAERSRPDYVPRKTFVLALLGRLATDGEFPADLKSLKSTVSKLPEGGVRDSLTALVESAGDSYDQAKESIGDYFDSVMDQLSGWYKRLAQVNLFFISFVLAAVLGADALHVGRALWNDPVMRVSVVEAAERFLEAPPEALASEGEETEAAAGEGAEATPEEEAEEEGPPTEEEPGQDDEVGPPAGEPEEEDCCRDEEGEGNGDAEEPDELSDPREEFEEYLEELQGLRLPFVDYNSYRQENCCRASSELGDGSAAGSSVSTEECIGHAVCSGRWLWSHLFGFFLTAVAASIGAPFWFDLLNRLVNLRSALKTTEPVEKGGSAP